MTKVAIFGAGQIGRAVNHIIRYSQSSNSCLTGVNTIIIDENKSNLELTSEPKIAMNLSSLSDESISDFLIKEKVTHIINALPFFLNEKIAKSAVVAGCHYIDFTEDDIMADKVQEIFKNSSKKLNCAVKCGLAPGFINYVGYKLINQIYHPETLMISVGALPRTVSYNSENLEDSYNLTWSVDGLVNEYIRPCRVKQNNIIKEIPALSNLTKVILDGTEYEAAHTSGGIGSLINDLPDVANISYMTLRYPGHYQYVKEIVLKNNGDFDKIKKDFSNNFYFTNDDVIVVYANALGKNKDGKPVRLYYSNKFYGNNFLTGIQSTTAGSGVSVLELMLKGSIKGIINHKDILFDDFINTKSFQSSYKT